MGLATTHVEREQNGQQLRNICPRSAYQNVSYGCRANTELPAKMVQRWSFSGMQTAYLNNLFFRQLSPIAVASRLRSAFLVSVAVVVALCTKKQMGRIAAGWIVTAMQNTNAIGNRAIGKFVANAVSKCFATVNLDLPISMLFPSKPWPTIIRAANVNLLPESYSKWFVGWAMPLTISMRLSLDPSILTTCFLGDSRGLTAATSTKARLCFGALRGIVTHVNRLLTRWLIMQRDALTSPLFFVGYSIAYE